MNAKQKRLGKKTAEGNGKIGNLFLHFTRLMLTLLLLLF